MKWSIGRQVDGVITDDPLKFLEVCKKYDETAPRLRVRVKDYGSVLFLNFLILVFGGLYRMRNGFKADPQTLKKYMEAMRNSRTVTKPS